MINNLGAAEVIAAEFARQSIDDKNGLSTSWRRYASCS